MATTAPVSSLHQLQTLFPTSLFLDAHALAGVLGIAHKRLNNAGDGFPIRPVRFGRRKYYRIVDVAAYIDSELGLVPQSQPQVVAPAPVSVAAQDAPRRGRGRPRKVGV